MSLKESLKDYKNYLYYARYYLIQRLQELEYRIAEHGPDKKTKDYYIRKTKEAKKELFELDEILEELKEES